MSSARFPDPVEVLRESTWLKGVPGLDVAALEWWHELAAVRRQLASKARRLAQPRLDPRVVVRAGQIGVELTRTGAGLAGRAALAGSRPDRLAVATDLRRTFERLGPTYIKLGQLIASAAGLVPDDVAAEFGKCRDAVPADPPDVVLRTVAGALGPMESTFADFDVTPVASASIAQVHPATLRDGREVVVKVRHPGIRRRFYADITLMAWQAAFLDRFSKLGIVNPPAFVELFASMAVQELDLRLEALNMVEIGASIEHAGLDYVFCPRPVPGLVTSRVLVMERIDGIPYGDPQRIRAAGVDTVRLISLGIKAVMEGTLVYGIFHGDLHAGNLLVVPPEGFGLLDYGIVGRLDIEQRLSLARFITAALRGDVEGQIEAMAAFDAFGPGADLSGLIASLEKRRRRVEAALQSDRIDEIRLDDIAREISAVVDALAANGFRMPVQLMLFAKNLLYLQASIVSLAPDMDVFAEVFPIFMYMATKHGTLLSRSGRGFPPIRGV
jgi:ubiquinone biosynthesis protein